MDPKPRILGPDGRVLEHAPSRASMLAGGSRVPYDAADNIGSAVAEWFPYLWSTDGEVTPYRDRMVARMRDLVRNDGWASGVVTRFLDTAIGANFRPVSKPDYRALARYSGLKTFDHAWAREYGQAVDANWRGYANDPGRWCDLERGMSMSQMFRLGFRHQLIDGDAIAQLHWKPRRVALGRARYATTLQVIDPDRLSNPNLVFDSNTIRGGCELDADGATVAFHIRQAHQGDWFSAAQSYIWKRIPRETSFGRPVVVHHFERERAGQHRGVGILAPVVQRLKMLTKMDDAELKAAVLNAFLGAYIESPFDPQMVEGALTTKSDLGPYQTNRANFHRERNISLGDMRLPILFPGEKVNAITATRGNENFVAFEDAFLRNVASATGLAPQQVSNNWAQMNYSSARGATQEAWKTVTRRRDDFAQGFPAPIRMAWLEESHDVDELPLPAGAPSFIECRGAYAQARWLGPAMGWLDPVDEKAGAILGMDGCLSTLEFELAEQSLDLDEVLDQRGYEIQMFKDRGIPLPTWANAESARDAAKKPEAE